MQYLSDFTLVIQESTQTKASRISDSFSSTSFIFGQFGENICAFNQQLSRIAILFKVHNDDAGRFTIPRRDFDFEKRMFQQLVQAAHLLPGDHNNFNAYSRKSTKFFSFEVYIEVLIYRASRHFSRPFLQLSDIS